MDREPFATVVEHVEDAAVCVKVGGKTVAEYTEDVGMTLAEYVAGIINAAHEDRVKEAEKKAIAWAQYQCGCAKCVGI